jgi:hypothetical protein
MKDGDEDAVTDTETSPNSFSLPELILKRSNIFVTFRAADYDIEYFSAAVQEQILGLPDTLAARSNVNWRSLMVA